MTKIQNVIRGIFWSGADRFSVQIVQFFISVILARLLTPQDFGLLAMMLVVINIIQVINEVGFGEALMQKLNRDELDFSTIFIFNIIFGVTLYGIIFLMAPLIAIFFEFAELTQLIRILGINVIITSVVVVPRTRLFILVDFKTQAKASFISIVFSGCIGVYCAYIGFGVMALLFQSLLFNGINTVLIWIFVKWHPKIQFSYNRFFTLYKYAYKLIFARLINSIFNEAYSLIIGKIYSPTELGFFNRAKSFEQLSSNNITNLVQRVSTPLLCEEQKNKERMGVVLLKFIQNTALVVYPLLCGMFVLAEPLIVVLLTEKWIFSAWILKVLCPVGLLYVISTFNMNIFNATGRTDLALKSEVLKKSIFIVILIVAIYKGFHALVYSQILIAAIEFYVNIYYTKKQIGLRLMAQIKNIIMILLSSVIMSCFIWLSTLLLNNNISKLIVGIGVGVIVYFLLCYFFNIAYTRKLLFIIKNKYKD